MDILYLTLIWFCDETKHVLLSAAIEMMFEIFKYYLYLSCCNFSVLYSLKILHRCYGIPLESDHSGCGVLHVVSEQRLPEQIKFQEKLFSKNIFGRNIFKKHVFNE